MMGFVMSGKKVVVCTRSSLLQSLHSLPHLSVGRGLGSRLFSIVKSVGAPLLKDVILPIVKQEAGQVLKDITSGAGIKRP